VSTDTKDPLSLELALWLHDIIYDTNSADNEERSAEFASSFLGKLTISPKRTERVKELILATKNVGRESKGESGRETAGSGDTADMDSAHIRDIDLSVLGAPPSEYKDYIEAVRKEYAQYNEKQFNEGRVSFLRQFLEKDRIYSTDYFFARFEARARDNLFRELKMRSPSDAGTSQNQKP
jgi:predicted metal-dependent HD superfamily phosphohydrolase